MPIKVIFLKKYIVNRNKNYDLVLIASQTYNPSEKSEEVFKKRLIYVVKRNTHRTKPGDCCCLNTNIFLILQFD